MTTHAERLIVLALVLLLAATGCRGRGATRQDAEIRRQTTAGGTAYAEGHDVEAVSRYQRALKRAWAIDDPIEIGSNAYNLAICLAAVGYVPEARDWLREARAELRRAGQDESAVWLLDAELARQEGLLVEAETISAAVGTTLRRGERRPTARNVVFEHEGHLIEPPPDDRERRRGWTDSAAYQLASRLKEATNRRERVEERRDELGSTAHWHLLNANLALDWGDFERADRELVVAEQLVRRLDEAALAAEAARVRGRWLVEQGDLLSAALRFDYEAEALRRAGHYREIPRAVENAGMAYEGAGLILPAAERYHRVARILFGRDELIGSLMFIDRAVPLAEMSGDGDIQGRLAVLFKAVSETVADDAERERRRQSRGRGGATPQADGSTGAVGNSFEGGDGTYDTRRPPSRGPVVEPALPAPGAIDPRPLPGDVRPELLPPGAAPAPEGLGPELIPRGASGESSGPAAHFTDQLRSLLRSVRR